MTLNPVLVSAGVLVSTASSFAQVTFDESLAAAAQLNAGIQTRLNALSTAAQVGSTVSGQLQFRYNLNQRDDSALAEDLTTGFHMRRAKLKFSGRVGERLSYRVAADFSRSTGSTSLSDGFVKIAIENDVNVMIGQFKLPFEREYLVSSAKQLAADRSVASSFFSVGRSQGVQLSKTADRYRLAVAVSDGGRASNSDFISTAEADYGLTARIDYRFAGDDWEALGQFTSRRGSAYTGMLGGAVHYQSGGETFGTDDMDMTAVTADVSVLGNGWNAFAAIHWTRTEPAGGSDIENSGLIVQSGFYLSQTWEAFSRYDTVFSDQVDDFSTATVGVNKYLIPESHAAKVTADLQYFLDAQGKSDAPASTGTGLLESDEDSQWAMRLQLQLLF